MNRTVLSDARGVSRAALIAALRPDGDELADSVRAHSNRVDWPWLLERAAAHKVIALLAARVEQYELASALGEPVAERLRAARADSRRHAEIAQETLRALSSSFERERIPFFVVKGSVLAEHVYADAALRRFFDVDVVVPPDAIARAETLLRSMGYHLGQVQKLLADEARGDAEVRLAEELTHRFYRRWEYELPFAAPRGEPRLAVDLHWHIAPQSRMRVGAEELWQHTTQVRVADLQVLTLTPAATVIHLAVHATTSAFAGFRLLHLCDVAWAAARFRDEMDGFWWLADKWGASAHLAAVFEMTERVLGVTLPLALHRAGRRPGVVTRHPFDVVARDTFLLGDADASSAAWWRRAWVEALWSIAMGCLRHNLVRSLRVRIARIHWQWERRRLPRHSGDR